MISAERPINLISVCYSDRAIAWDKVWNPNVKIQDTAQSPSLSPFATLGDLSALQNLKVKVERDKRYTFSQIATFYNKKHNIPNIYTTSKGRRVINRHNLNRLGYGNLMGRACKKLGINLSKGNLYNGRSTYSISLNEWGKIRAEMYNIIQAQTKYKKQWRDYIWERQAIGGGHNNKPTKVKIFDYFFTHLKEYESEQLYTNIKVQNALHNLFATPEPNEINYIAHRIFKNHSVMQIFLNRIGEVFFFNRVFKEYKKDRQARGGTRLIQASKGYVKILQTAQTGRGFDIFGKSVIILTMRQLKAILVLMEYFNSMFMSGKGGEYLEVGIRSLKRFLANPQEYEQRYKVIFTENKTYKSLWL